MDIVEELRERSKRDDAIIVGSEIRAVIQAQADEIERLRAALEEIASYWRQEQCSQMAQEALKPHQDSES